MCMEETCFGTKGGFGEREGRVFVELQWEMQIDALTLRRHMSDSSRLEATATRVRYQSH